MKRRSFIKNSAVATFGFQFVPSHVLRAQDGKVAPNDRLRIAAIGVGGRGAADLGGMQDEDIVALCDVDEKNAAGSHQKFPQAKRYKDFRNMFDAMADNIDGVLVATPDHFHAVAVMAALDAGKHVYCEKPLSHTIAEVRAMRKAALEKGVITQVGNQGHSSDSIRFFVELVKAGAVGKVQEVHAGCDAFKEVYCQIAKGPDFAQKHTAPETLSWNQWLGPALDRPYHPNYLPFSWRGYSAFGSGCIGDWVCHVLDPIFWALDLDMPTAITAETTGYDPKVHKEFYPAGSRITFEFAAKGDNGPIKIIWHDGEFSIPAPEELAQDNRKVVGTGAVVIGDAGKIMHGSHGAGGCRIIPEAKMKEFPRPDQSIPRVPAGDHQKDWLNAVRDNKPAGSPFEYGGALTEIGLLGMIAIQRSGTRLEWDAEAMKFTNDSEANALIDPAYRQGWKKPWI
jgi:predicted dehydrogenase